MSRTPSPRVSSSTRSAISAAALSLLALSAACSRTLQPPHAAPSAPQLWHVGVPVQLDGSASAAYQRQAPNATPALSFHWSFTSVPPRSTARLNDAALAKPSFTPDAPGSYALQLVVDDGVMSSAPAAVAIDVRNDCAPVVMTFAPVEAPAIGGTVVLGATLGSPCSGSADVAVDNVVGYRWSFAAVPPGSAAVIAQPQSAQASFVADVRGDYDIVLVVTDAFGLQNDPADPKSHFKVSARPCGDNPPVVVSIAANPGAPDVLQTVSLSAVVTDADIDVCAIKTRSLSYSWQLASVPAGSSAKLNNPQVKAPSFTPDVAGNYLVALVAGDDLGRKSARQTLTISTSGCGSAIPVAVAQITAPAGSIAVGQGVQLGVTVTDSDNPAAGGLNPTGTTAGGASDGGACAIPLTFSYQWTLVSAPKGSRVAIAAGLANPSFTPDVQGDYVFSVAASASTGKTSSLSFVTAHVANCGSLAPAAVISAPAGWITGRPLGPPDLGSAVTDPNELGGCALSVRPFQYAWSILQAPAGSAAQTSALVAPSFLPDVSGTYQLGLVVTDALGLASPLATATIQVGSCNVPVNVGTPTVKSGSLITGQPIQFAAAVTDSNDPGATPGQADAGACQAAVFPLTYSWSLVDQPAGSAAVLNNAGSAAPSLVPDKTGNYGLVLAVTDAAGNRGLSRRGDFAVSTNCNAAPQVAVSVTTGPAVTGLPLALLASPSDLNAPDGGASGCAAPVLPFSYSWTLSGQPAGSRALLNNASAANPSFVPDVAGDYLVSVVVTDAANNRSAPTVFDVNVPVACNGPLAAAIKVNGASAGFQASGGQPVALSATISDPNAPGLGLLADGGAYDGGAANGCQVATQPYSYLWSLVALPAGSKAALNNRIAATPSFTADVTGPSAVYSVQLVVTDAAGNKSPALQADIPAPQAAACNQPLSFGASPAVTFTPGASLVTGQAVTLGTAAITNPNAAGCYAGVSPALNYQWQLVSRPPRSSAAVTDPFAAAPRFTADQPGYYVVALRVSDALGNSAAGSATSPQVSLCGSTFQVVPTLQLPSATSSAEVGEPVQLTAEVNDNNAAACGAPVAPFSFAWLLTPPASSTSAVLQNSRGAQVSFTPDAPGSYGYAVTVTDAVGQQTTVTSVTDGGAPSAVDVRNCAITPAITASPAGNTLAEGTTVQLTASWSVPAGCNGLFANSDGGAPLLDGGLASGSPQPVSLAWSFDQVPAGSSASFNSNRIPDPSFVVDKPNGTWVVRLAVTDTLGQGIGGNNNGNGNAIAPATTTVTLGSSACGSQALLPGAKVISAAGAPPGGGGNGAVATSTTPSAPTNLGNFTLATAGQSQLQFDGTLNAAGTTLVDPNQGGCASPMQYSWVLYAVPPGGNANLSPQNAARPTMTMNVKGTYVVQLTINDGVQTSAPLYLSVTAQ